MAESLSHKFGQIIGELLEIALQPNLEKFAKKHKLFLDKKGERLVRKGKKLTWVDIKNNTHDLDFVLERAGTGKVLGTPVAFIEIAWRKSTRHSKNKVQEIQGAIIPLAEKYKNSIPFLGVLLAGRFTNGALNQLRSLGFSVLYFPSETVINAFKKFGIDADSDDYTLEKEYKRKIDSWKKTPHKEAIAKELINLNKKEVDIFFSSLSDSVSRYIDNIFILPLHGQESSLGTITEAIFFLENYIENNLQHLLVKYEIIIRYNTGDKIEASFKEKKDAMNFLGTYNKS